MNLNHIAKKPFFDLFYKTPCMPIMVRLAFHDAGTYDAHAKTGGANGNMFHEEVLTRPDQAGLRFAVDRVREMKSKGNHITALLSLADLAQLSAYAAIEYTGGPTMNFRMGRKDVDENNLPPDGLLPNPHEPERVMNTFERMGFNAQEYVALMGTHTLGFARADRSGFEGRWVQNPYVFDNSYYTEILKKESKFLRTQVEIDLATKPEFREHVERYAES